MRPWPEPESEPADGGGAGGVARVRREGAIGGFTVEWPVWHEVAGPRPMSNAGRLGPRSKDGSAMAAVTRNGSVRYRRPVTSHAEDAETAIST